MSTGNTATDNVISNRVKANATSFINKCKQLAGNKNTAKWFYDFTKHLETFTNSLVDDICELESVATVSQTVSSNLESTKNTLLKRIESLEEEIEEMQQYSRRTNVLIHGVEETDNESTDDIAMNIIKENLGLTQFVPRDIGRSHRLGKKKNDNKKRPIIVRLASYRQKKQIYDAKRGLKNSGIVITENLTKQRYSLYQKCKEKYGQTNCWTLDGRIFCLTGKKLPNGKDEKKIIFSETDLIE